MDKILTIKKAIIMSEKLHRQKKRIVLVGGCFDIVHIGHIKFLQNAKQEGDILMVMIEHDDTIKKNKGANRPVNTQADRADLLANLTIVDYVITLPVVASENFYDDLVNQLKPAIIATTAGDPYRIYKERQAEQIGAKVVDVIKPVTNKSTTRVIAIVNEL